MKNSPIFVFLLFLATPSLAYSDAPPLKLTLAGWAQAGYVAQDDPEGGDIAQDFYIGLARTSARAIYDKWGHAHIQFSGDGGDVRVLDVVAEVRPIEPLSIRMGQFKVPTSADVLIGAAATPFVNRSLLVRMVQTYRVGGEVEGRLGAGPTRGSVRAGWFLPTAETRALLPSQEGSFLSLASDLHISKSIAVHAAFLTLAFADRDAFFEPRPVPYDRQFDLAVKYNDFGWTVHVEGLANFEGPTDDAGVTFATFAHVLKDFPVGGDGHSIEPGFRYDVVNPGPDVLNHRLTFGLNYYFFGNFLNATTNYELALNDGADPGHAVYLQLQAGFAKTFAPPAPAETLQ